MSRKDIVMDDAKITRTEVTHHVFNYPTHAVVWSTYYNAKPQDNQSLGQDRTPDGGEMFVYCVLCLTIDDAHELCASRNTPARLFQVTTIHHTSES
jgi:hypothetical protein